LKIGGHEGTPRRREALQGATLAAEAMLSVAPRVGVDIDELNAVRLRLVAHDAEHGRTPPSPRRSELEAMIGSDTETICQKYLQLQAALGVDPLAPAVAARHLAAMREEDVDVEEVGVAVHEAVAELDDAIEELAAALVLLRDAPEAGTTQRGRRDVARDAVQGAERVHAAYEVLVARLHAAQAVLDRIGPASR
jgi:hypothetical protein